MTCTVAGCRNRADIFLCGRHWSGLPVTTRNKISVAYPLRPAVPEDGPWQWLMQEVVQQIEAEERMAVHG